MSFSGRIQIGWVNVNEPSAYYDDAIGPMCLQPGHFPIEATFEDGRPVPGTISTRMSAVAEEEGKTFGRAYEVQHVGCSETFESSVKVHPDVEVNLMPFLKNDFSIDDQRFTPEVKKAHAYLPVSLSQQKSPRAETGGLSM